MDPVNHIHWGIAALKIALESIGNFFKGVRVVAARKPMPQSIPQHKILRAEVLPLDDMHEFVKVQGFIPQAVGADAIKSPTGLKP